MDPASRIGSVIDKRYEVISLLGQGGMGDVYLARHLLVNRKVALKCLKPKFASRPKVTARFQREAMAASAIGNPHIVDVTDMGHFEDGSLFMVMEYLEGRDLADEIKHCGPLPLARVVDMVTQACEALAGAHAQGIIHRDLKPDNLFLITRDGRPDFVKIVDFGISKFTGEMEGDTANMTATGAVMGTPYFMAPEQMLGQDIDGRADIYALGGIMFRALTATYPFEANAHGALVMKVCHEPPPALSELRPDLPPSVEAVVNRAMAKKADDRFADCGALAKALSTLGDEAFADTVAAASQPVAPNDSNAGTDDTVLAPPDGSPAHAISAETEGDAPKSRRMAMLLGGLVVIGLAVAVVAMQDAEPEVPQPKPVEPEPPVKAPELNRWIRVDPPADPAQVVLGLPEVGSADASGFRAELGVTAPEISYAIHQHEVTWGEIEPWLQRQGKELQVPAHAPAEPKARARMPASGIPWKLASAYCKHAGGSLPTEAQWEYAARGSTLRPSAWGSARLDLQRTNAYGGSKAALAAVMTSAQDRTPGPASSAIFDLIGNAREWTADLWRDDLPNQDESWVQAEGRSYRTVRGLPPNGTAPPNLSVHTAAYREPLCSDGPCPDDVKQYLPWIGFRCVKELK